MYIYPPRRVVRTTGTDAKDFLNRVLTCRTDDVEPGSCRFGALLTPQGKILTDLFVLSTGTDLWLDLPAIQADDVVRRLTLLKLRADATFESQPDHVLYIRTAETAIHDNSILEAFDPRTHSPEVVRGIAQSNSHETPEDHPDWKRYRIGHVLPECGTDYEPGSVFPSDVNMDLLQGIDYRKGCFVGQEVVSRMKRKTEVRKRTCRVTGPTRVGKGDLLMSGTSTLGEVLCWQGDEGLVLIRTDRLQAAHETGASSEINGQPAQAVELTSLEANR